MHFKVFHKTQNEQRKNTLTKSKRMLKLNADPFKTKITEVNKVKKQMTIHILTTLPEASLTGAPPPPRPNGL